MVVRFSEEFEKQLKRQFSKKQAIEVIKKLDKTVVTEGDVITTVANVVLKEKKYKSFRFYFVHRNDQIRFLSEKELHSMLIQFIALSKITNNELLTTLRKI